MTARYQIESSDRTLSGLGNCPGGCGGCPGGPGCRCPRCAGGLSGFGNLTTPDGTPEDVAIAAWKQGVGFKEKLWFDAMPYGFVTAGAGALAVVTGSRKYGAGLVVAGLAAGVASYFYRTSVKKELGVGMVAHAADASSHA